eukprot:scaffold2893_cov225-Skeletonema_marinoi.AAC.2
MKRVHQAKSKEVKPRRGVPGAGGTDCPRDNNCTETRYDKIKREMGISPNQHRASCLRFPQSCILLHPA